GRRGQNRERRPTAASPAPAGAGTAAAGTGGPGAVSAPAGPGPPRSGPGRGGRAGLWHHRWPARRVRWASPSPPIAARTTPPRSAAPIEVSRPSRRALREETELGQDGRGVVVEVVDDDLPVSHRHQFHALDLHPLAGGRYLGAVRQQVRTGVGSRKSPLVGERVAL